MPALKFPERPPGITVPDHRADVEPLEGRLQEVDQFQGFEVLDVKWSGLRTNVAIGCRQQELSIWLRYTSHFADKGLICLHVLDDITTDNQVKGGARERKTCPGSQKSKGVR
jgi:hypothetical protein